MSDATAALAVDPERAILLFRLAGTVGAADLRATYTHPAAAEVYRPGMVVITDLERAVIDASYTEMQSVMEHIDLGFRSAGGEPASGAIIAPADVSFGLSRMYKLLTGNAYPTLEVFRTWDEATRWLDLEPAVVQALATRLVPLDLRQAATPPRDPSRD